VFRGAARGQQDPNMAHFARRDRRYDIMSLQEARTYARRLCHRLRAGDRAGNLVEDGPDEWALDELQESGDDASNYASQDEREPGSSQGYGSDDGVVAHGADSNRERV
jgi:hypothetical protein